MRARLRAVASLVPAGASSLVDVGAGDGQLSRALARRGMRVIATEAAELPFERLRRLTPGVDCRFGAGLDPVLAGEAQGAVLAGMGGRTIAAILARGATCAAAMRWLVLQPQQRARELEQWLARHRYRVRHADWAIENRRLYRVLLVEPPWMTDPR